MTNAEISLRPARMSDVDDFYEFFSNDDVMRYWSTAPHTDRLQTVRFLRQMINGKWNGTRDFVIEYAPPTARPKVIGKLGLWDGHEIGFMLHQDFWGRGVMKQVMNMFFPRLWSSKDAQDLQDITADVDPRNAACLALLKKFGFEESGYRERTYETHLGWCDSVDLVLRRPDAAR